jgi:hypothetical protein
MNTSRNTNIGMVSKRSSAPDCPYNGMLTDFGRGKKKISAG